MKALKDYSMKTKLYGQLVVGIAGLVFVVVMSQYVLIAYRVSGPVYQRIDRLKEFKNDICPPILFNRTTYVILQELENETNPDEIRAQSKRFLDQVNDFERTHAEYRANMPDGELKRQLESEVYPPGAEFQRIGRDEFLPLVGKPGQKEELSKLLADRIRPLYRRHREAAERLIPQVERVTLDEEKRAFYETREWSRVVLLVSIGWIVLLIALKWVVASNILKALREIIAKVEEMAGGSSDLTARVAVDSKDEFGRLADGINAVIAKIHTVVTKVRESSLSVLSAASEIAATARQQESTVSGLSAATTEVAAAVREISATGKELSGTMDEVNGRANQAASIATSGRDRLAAMERTMHQLVDSTASISGKLSTIREKADNINMVVTTITKVADQTNLLSINAAIEAEKAGEFGRGFLVVAREIRRLADQTAVATLDIESIVRLMQDAVAAGVMQMDKFSDEVRTSVTRVAEINTQTGQIIAEVTGLSDRFRSVNEGMRNQAVGAGQINEAMADMTGNIRQTAGALEEFNSATTNLRGSIETLNQEIAQFKV